MQWLEKLRQHRNPSAHMFLLYNNVADDVLRDTEFERLHEVLSREAPLSDAFFLVFFNLGTGIRFADPKKKKAFIDLVVKDEVSDGMSPEAYFEEYKHDPAHALRWIGKALRYGWGDGDVKRLFSSEKKNEEKKEEKKEEPKAKKDAPFCAAVFEYIETLVPPEAASDNPRDRFSLVTFLWWAQDAEIRRRKNLVILQTNGFAGLAPELRGATTSIIPIEVELPTREEQRQALTVLRKEVPRRDGDMDEAHLLRLIKGMPFLNVRQIMHEARARNEALSVNMIFRRKKSFLEEQSGGLLEVKKIPYGYEALGSLEYVVRYLKDVVEALKAGNLRKIPRGVMFIGPPGVGKTAAAEVIAHEADVPFVQFNNNIRDPFVGQSERRWELILKTLLANGPLIWFIDEIDKYFPNPDEMYMGDSGVSSGLQGMLQEFLSDPRVHGTVFPVAATNRPGRLNTSLIRPGRFDDKFPFLLPKAEARPDIIRALLAKHEVLLGESGFVLKHNVTEDALLRIAEISDFWIDPDRGLLPGPRPEQTLESDIVSLTGVDLETVLKSAIGKIGDTETLTGDHITREMKKYLPSHDMNDYRRMHVEALAYASNEDFIPEEYRDEWRRIKARRGGAQSNVLTS